jgi:hypothetical protein
LLTDPAADSDLDEAAERLRERLLTNLATLRKRRLDQATRDAYSDLQRAQRDRRPR